MLRSMHVTSENQSLLTDLYELTMAAGFWANRVIGTATFELYFRRLPSRRSYVLAAGLEQALEYIVHLRFTSDQMNWLRSRQNFKNVDSGFFDYLAQFKFSGEVWAIAEGTPVFPLEPMIQVTAPLIEAQILETYLLSTVNMQSMIATKGARIVKAAAGRGVIDFGTRRAHGPEAGVLAARAAYLAGCLGTSNTLAGYLADIPIYGTTAHSFIMAFAEEMEAFEAYQKAFSDSTVLLIDTYDTLEAARKIKSLKGKVLAVRIDSGDLLDLSREVRKILDENGLESVKIFASGDLNEYKIEDLLSHEAPIDLFGVGTELVTSYDDPALSGVYKMVESTIGGKLSGRMKVSPGKVSYPGRKQIYRFTQNSYYSHDLVTLSHEHPPTGGTPLLKCYVRDGELVETLPALKESREQTMEQLKHLPPAFHRLSSVEDYPVIFSDSIRAELKQR